MMWSQISLDLIIISIVDFQSVQISLSSDQTIRNINFLSNLFFFFFLIHLHSVKT